MDNAKLESAVNRWAASLSREELEEMVGGDLFTYLRKSADADEVQDFLEEWEQ